MPDWKTPADTVAEIQDFRGLSLYDARMEMFGELFTGVRKAKGVRDGIEQEIERGWFIGQIGQQGVDWEQSTMSKYGVRYSDLKISQIERSHEIIAESEIVKFDWDQFWVEIVRIADTPGGLPVDEDILYRHLIDFCAGKFSDPPNEIAIRRKLALLSR